ncbi:hypothetical protein RJ639_038865 [Escallonia herrerae]|uniref:Bifunctional inhibitor/plant lipid transfer protein/seed storage helical domain-containing protein n=1 Tax=Escallonia herrerae TaxID=1293975 RepID=A0AA88WLQ9_9ASTE|nr:hypothetical protein RJ639_038865 [Escallonia herrerae]
MVLKCVSPAGLRCVSLLILVGFASSDLSKDREQCADQLVGLATCLPYVGGDAKAPTLDCCAGIKQVLQKSRICLCILVKDRNDPGLGLKINATLALGLPGACHAPANISECPGHVIGLHDYSPNDYYNPALLHLAPHSPGAKVFEDFVNSTKVKASAPAAAIGNGTRTGSSAQLTSNGGRGKKWLGVEMAWALFITVLKGVAKENSGPLIREDNLRKRDVGEKDEEKENRKNNKKENWKGLEEEEVVNVEE